MCTLKGLCFLRFLYKKPFNDSVYKRYGDFDGAKAEKGLKTLYKTKKAFSPNAKKLFIGSLYNKPEVN